MRILVVCSSKYGATRGIAERITQGLESAGHQAATVDPAHAGRLEGYDAYVIGSALYMFSWLKDATDFVLHNSTQLSARPVWLFSSGPLGTATKTEKGEDVRDGAGPKELPQLTAAVHPREHHVFFGAFDHTRLNMAHRMIYAMPAAKKVFVEGDFRDWGEIDAWAKTIAASLVPAGVS